MDDETGVMIDLTRIPIAVISLPFQERRRNRIGQTLSAAGLRFDFVDGVQDTPRHRGCSKAHLKAIQMLKGRAPFLVLEDDVITTEYLLSSLVVPKDCALFYLGHSAFGYSEELKFEGPGWEIAEADDSGYLRVHSMLAAHAILYMNEDAALAVEQSIMASIERGIPRRHDIGLCEIQTTHKVLTVQRPFFDQDDYVQLGKKAKLRRDIRQYSVRPRQEWQKHGCMIDGVQREVILRRGPIGELKWKDAALADETTILGVRKSEVYGAVAQLDVEPDLQGWNSTHPIFKAIIDETRPRLIVEVGVWKGASVIHMAKTARAAGVECRIIAIDTWLGSPEHWLDAKLRDDLRLRNGYPTLFEVFLKNICHAGVEDMVEPIPLPSESAAFILAAKQVRADVIHIDAGHEYESVYRDLQQYFPLLKDDGILIGDDYGGSGFQGVKKAFDRFCKRNGLKLKKIGRKCVCARAEAFDATVVPLLEKWKL